MKKYIITFLLGIFLLPNIALGSVFESGKKLHVDESINEDLYAGVETLNIQKNVNGDVIAAADEILVDGFISQDLMAGAEDIFISGEVGDDVRVIGNKVELDGIIGGDMMAAAGKIVIGKASSINGDVNLFAEDLTINGIIEGDLRLAGGTTYLNADIRGDLNLVVFEKLEFGPNAKIQGSFSYRSTEELKIPENLVVGDVIFKKSMFQQSLSIMALKIFTYFLLATLFFGLFMIWIYRFFFIHAIETVYNDSLKSLGVGLLILIITPIASLIFMITAIGIPLALALMAIWLILLFVAKVMAAMLIGFKLTKVDEKSSFINVFMSFVLGAFIYSLIGFIPYFGWAIKFVLIVIALGGYGLYSLEVMKKLRKNELV